MFIIFIAHVPRDFWALWIPARFGFSDATEMFVFCSGMASALAFGGVFQNKGWWMGTARILLRVWQVYWAHVCLFFAVLLLVTTVDQAKLLDTDYSFVGGLNLLHFSSKTPDLIIGLFSLTYVPNYFDILPMYLVILAMIPLVMGLSRISVTAVFVFICLVWFSANLHLIGMTPINFPAEPWSDRVWFFNPFGWQLCFFTGFAFMRGWLKPPPVNSRLVAICAAVVLLTIPVAYFRLLNAYPELREIAALLNPLTTKTEFGLFRFLHFLALAYLAWVMVGPGGCRIQNLGIMQIVVDVIRKVGQQSLAVFISSMFFAQVVGMYFKVNGYDWVTVAMGNLSGFLVLITVAYSVAWFKSEPWRKPTPGHVSRHQKE